MTREDLDFIGALNMHDVISNEAYKKIVCHFEGQEPCNDAISRQAVLDLVEHYNSDGLGAVFYGYEEGVKFASAIKKLPSVTPQETRFIAKSDGTIEQIKNCCSHCDYKEWLEDEIETCEDCISRQAVIQHICEEKFCYKENCKGNTYKRCPDIMWVYDLPPVIPQSKTGHWVQINEFFINQDGKFIYKFICSECKSISYFRKSNKKAIGANVCPNCGAKMESEGEE